MSRSKQNETHFTKYTCYLWFPKAYIGLQSHRSQHIRWSVEWVHPDGSATKGMCPEDQPLEEAYHKLLHPITPSHSGQKRRWKRPRLGKLNRESELERPPKDSVANDPLAAQGPSSPHHANKGEEEQTLNPIDHEGRSNPEDASKDTSNDDNVPRKRVDSTTQAQLHQWKQDIIRKRKLDSATNDRITEATQEEVHTTPALVQPLSFYLHHPSLPSPQPVLTPLSSEATLYTPHTNRLVLEFPTN